MPKLNQFKLRLVSNLFVACLGGAFAGSLFGQQLDLQTPQPATAEVSPPGLEERIELLESQIQNQQNTIDFQQQQIQSLEQSVPLVTEAVLVPATNSKPLPKTIIGGQYRLMYNSSNFDFHQPSVSDTQNNSTFLNQRFRTWLTVNANEHVRGYVQAEIGHILWGDEFDFPKTYVVAPPRDRSGVEMRFGYVEYETSELGVLRGGIQGWNDRFSEMLASSTWDFSVGGLLWHKKTTDGIDLSAGLFQLVENNTHFSDDSFLLVTDADLINEDSHSFGVSGYYLQDRGAYSYPASAGYHSSWDSWIGIRDTVNLDIAKLNSFFIYNVGARDELGALPTYSHDGFALRTELAGLQIGPGKWSTQGVYSTGNRTPGSDHSNEFRTIAQSARDNFGAQSYWGYLAIVSPHGPSDVDDLGVSLQNRGLGLFTVQSKYEYPIYERLTGTSAAGWLRSDAKNPVSQSSDMGTELMQEFTFNFGGGLKSDFGAAVLYTGNFYRSSPVALKSDDLFEAYTRVQLEF